LRAAARPRLRLLAAGAPGGAAPVLRAGRGLGLGAGALGPAEAGRLVRAEGARIEFRHPLIRSAIYRAATFAERRAVHLALAGALEGVGQADRRAWHRAAAAVAPDDVVAGELGRSARRAPAPRGHAAAPAAPGPAAPPTRPEPTPAP